MKRLRFILPLVAFAALVLVLGYGIRHSQQKKLIVSPLIGKPAPDFTLPSLADAHRMISNRDLRGQWYVLNVWGTWCYACREEQPALMQVRRMTSIPIIGLDWNDDSAQARTWLTKLGNPYNAVAVDHDGSVAIDWGVYGAPETFLVNPQGIVVHKQIGPMTTEVWKRDFASRMSAGGKTAASS